MDKLTENPIEEYFIDLLKSQGYTYYRGTDIAPEVEHAGRDSFSDVILQAQFKAALKRLNPDVPESARVETYRHVINLGSTDLMANNEKFHSMLTDGVTVEYFKDGVTKGVLVKLIDFDVPSNNEFWAVNQFSVTENNVTKRFDVVLFVNGLPLVFVELKSAVDEKATLEKAYTQIQNYKKATPSIFNYNAVCIISDGVEARTSSLSAPFSRFLAWKSPNREENGKVPELEILTREMLRKDVLLKLIRFNTVFEDEEVKDEETGLLSLIKIKKIAAYHQYYVVEKAVESTLRAIKSDFKGIKDKPEKYGYKSVSDQPEGDRKIGVVWHTQGSGKSLSMVFYVGQLVVEPRMKNPTIVVLTDRNDLDDQLFGTFSNCKALLRQTPVQAESRDNLRELLSVSGGGIVFTTIQKFFDGTGELSKRENIVVVADEAHRSQYGFIGKVDKDGNMKYGNAKYLRDALPNASFIGFTGTPIEKDDRDTKKVFGEYIDIYDIAQAVKDGATVPLSYEGRLVKVRFDEAAGEAIDLRVGEIEGASEEQLEKSKKRYAQINAIVGHPDRLKDVARDVVAHFEARQKTFEGKGMIVCMTRQIVVDLYNEIIRLRPDWHSEDLKKGMIKVVMTCNSSDPESFQPHSTSKTDRKLLATRLKDSNDELRLVIVQSMWLTGFDAPPLHTLYVDKRMQGAGLMQAIARVNRVYKDKPGGLIVDYIGIGQDLREAMGTYTASGGKGEAVEDISSILKGMKMKFEVVHQMFHGYDYGSYFEAETGEKLAVILGAQNFILESEKTKERFLSEVDKLSKLYAMAVPHEDAFEIRERVAFFQAIRSRIRKFTPAGGKTDSMVDTAVKQIVDDVLGCDGVVDIFEASGLAVPTVSILSEEFLLEIKKMQHQNVAFELLRKLLSDDIKIRKTKNLVQGKKFSDMLATAVKRYHNNQIDTAQVIKELSDIAREMNLEDNTAKELGLTPEEYAFYMVLSQNSSTTHLEDNNMKELIQLIVEIIRKNATVDWHKRDDVRAKLRLLVKKVLMRYGYPPDVAKMEADNVLAQSELLAENL